MKAGTHLVAVARRSARETLSCNPMFTGTVSTGTSSTSTLSLRKTELNLNLKAYFFASNN